jgi:hypothetical protein
VRIYTLSNHDKKTKLKDKHSRAYHFQRIKLKTKNDLEKLGIKRLFLSNKGKWYEYPERFYFFRKNGRIYIQAQLRNVGHMLWKIKNGKLYINPNNINMVNNGNKFHLIVVKAASPDAYSPDGIRAVTKSFAEFKQGYLNAMKHLDVYDFQN